MGLADEKWNLTPEEHLERAHQLLDSPLVSGEMANRALDRQVIGARHAALALLGMADEAATRTVAE